MGNEVRMMALSDRLKQLRLQKNITQEQLAKHLGIPRSTYSNYEYGNREPDANTLNKIADYFDVSVDYLLGRTDRKGYLTDERAWIIAEKISELPENRRKIIEEIIKSYEDE